MDIMILLLVSLLAIGVSVALGRAALSVLLWSMSSNNARAVRSSS